MNIKVSSSVPPIDRIEYSRFTSTEYKKWLNFPQNYRDKETLVSNKVTVQLSVNKSPQFYFHHKSQTFGLIFINWNLKISYIFIILTNKYKHHKSWESPKAVVCLKWCIKSIFRNEAEDLMIKTMVYMWFWFDIENRRSVITWLLPTTP
jgi:hypothetical protein